jgi:hypothetical protein
LHETVLKKKKHFWREKCHAQSVDINIKSIAAAALAAFVERDPKSEF